MKKFLILVLCSVSLFATAQKIALLEPRAGDGSIVSGMEKAMVRGELRKAIVNHSGFEAFTRADIDQLMQEQDFQRTGNVSEEDIHRMGEMSGADYLCISTLNKSANEFYLEAYLINVETGAISNPASQFGELINGKLGNMLSVCQALAQELLGVTQPVAQPVITQKTPNQNRPARNTSVQTKPQESNQQIASQALPKGIGEVKVFPDGSRGCVFYLADDGHGLAVSLDEAVMQWDSSRKKRDIQPLPNEDRIAKYIPVALGLQNTEAIIQTLGIQNAPAAAWCANHGEDWYLPSAGELWYLFVEANGGSQKKINKETINNGPINRAIIRAGGRPLSGDNYWSSSENDNDDVWKVSGSGSLGQSEKDDEEKVRAVRVF